MSEFPSFTKTWHNKPYAAIDPSRPELSAAGKTIFITGGGAGIGIALTRSFAAAGASVIAISGRTESRLLAAKKDIETAYPKTKVHTFAADIADEKAMTAAFQSVGKVDVLVNNAAKMSDLEPIATTTVTEWWKGVETTVKGAFIVVQAFLPVAAPNAAVINVTTGAAHLPPFQDHSSYAASKVAANKFFEAVQSEHPDLQVTNFHPGVIKSDMSDKSYEHGVRLPFDERRFPPPLERPESCSLQFLTPIPTPNKSKEHPY